jgi:hypothetical protein
MRYWTDDKKVISACRAFSLQHLPVLVSKKDTGFGCWTRAENRGATFISGSASWVAGDIDGRNSKAELQSKLHVARSLGAVNLTEV